MRVKNSDIQKVKSSGYRLIYYIKTPTKVILVTIYSKLDQEDIAAAEIRRILGEFDKQYNQTDVEQTDEEKTN